MHKYIQTMHILIVSVLELSSSYPAAGLLWEINKIFAEIIFADCGFWLATPSLMRPPPRAIKPACSAGRGRRAHSIVRDTVTLVSPLPQRRDRCASQAPSCLGARDTHERSPLALSAQCWTFRLPVFFSCFLFNENSCFKGKGHTIAFS